MEIGPGPSQQYDPVADRVEVVTENRPFAILHEISLCALCDSAVIFKQAAMAACFRI